MTTHHAPRSGQCIPTGPPLDVTSWRLCCLLDAGFEARLAARLAATRDIDIHALLQLVDRGCPPELAARILSPLPGPGVVS